MAKTKKAAPKLERGRPTDLTPAVAKRICNEIKFSKLSLRDCAAIVGVDEATLHGWKKRGREEGSGLFYDFHKAVEKARAEGSSRILRRIARAGRYPEHWKANATLLSMTEPQYAERVRVQIAEEMEDAVERLSLEFADTPDILERALRALVPENKSEDVEA